MERMKDMNDKMVLVYCGQLVWSKKSAFPHFGDANYISEIATLRQNGVNLQKERITNLNRAQRNVKRKYNYISLILF